MKATGEERGKMAGLSTTCCHSKVIVERYRVDSSPLSRGNGWNIAKIGERCGVASGKAKTIYYLKYNISRVGV
jgi:hypothetical protein